MTSGLQVASYVVSIVLLVLMVLLLSSLAG